MYRRNRWPLAVITILLCALASPIWGQGDDSQGSVAAAAARTKAEKSAPGHVTAKTVLNDDNNPKANTVLESRDYYGTIPPSKLTISIPVSSRPADFGYEVPLENSTVYVPFGETSWTDDFNEAARQFFEMIIARSRFRGVRLKLGTREETTVSDLPAVLVRLSFMFRGVGHDGVAVFIEATEQVVGFGCIYRSADWEKAGLICQQIVNSAQVSAPSEYRIFKKP